MSCQIEISTFSNIPNCREQKASGVTFHVKSFDNDRIISRLSMCCCLCQLYDRNGEAIYDDKISSWALMRLPTDCSTQSGEDRSHHDDDNQACSQYPKVTREIKNLTVKITNQEMTGLLDRNIFLNYFSAQHCTTQKQDN